MTKKRMPYVLLILCCVCTCLAKLSDDVETTDGYLTSGEYAFGVKLESFEKLTINGGGGDVIDAWDNSRLEIYSTSLPLSLYPGGGVYDIHLNDNSTLLFSGGATQSLKLGKNASAILTGGTINYVTIYRYGSMTCNATFYCREGWQWLYTSGKISGIKGLWGDGTSFQTTLSNAGSIFPDTWNFVDVKIVPEPTTMLLLGLGGLWIRRK